MADLEREEDPTPHVVRVPHDLPNFPPGAINTNSPAELVNQTSHSLPPFVVRTIAPGTVVIEAPDDSSPNRSRRPSATSTVPLTWPYPNTTSPVIPEEPEPEESTSATSKQPLSWFPFKRHNPNDQTSPVLPVLESNLDISDASRWLRTRDTPPPTPPPPLFVPDQAAQTSPSNPALHSPLLVATLTLFLVAISAATIATSVILYVSQPLLMQATTLYALVVSSISLIYALWTAINNVWGLPMFHRGPKGKFFLALASLVAVIAWSSALAMQALIQDTCQPNACSMVDAQIGLLAGGVFAWTAWIMLELGRVFSGVEVVKNEVEMTAI